MTRTERRKRLAEAYRIVSVELEHHFANGSEWLHKESDGSDSPEDVVKLRFKVLKEALLHYERKAIRIEESLRRKP